MQKLSHCVQNECDASRRGKALLIAGTVVHRQGAVFLLPFHEKWHLDFSDFNSDGRTSVVLV